MSLLNGHPVPLQASCLARCNGARVELRPYGTMGLEAFRAEVEAVCRSGEEHVVVSYSRKVRRYLVPYCKTLSHC